MVRKPFETAQNLHILRAVALFTIVTSESQIFRLLHQNYSDNSTLAFKNNPTSSFTQLLGSPFKQQ